MWAAAEGTLLPRPQLTSPFLQRPPGKEEESHGVGWGGPDLWLLPSTYLSQPPFRPGSPLDLRACFPSVPSWFLFSLVAMTVDVGVLEGSALSVLC